MHLFVRLLALLCLRNRVTCLRAAVGKRAIVAAGGAAAVAPLAASPVEAVRLVAADLAAALRE